MSAPDLRVRVGSLSLANPVLCASGTFGYGIEAPEAAARLGGIVTKTITKEPRAGNPPPRIVETASGLLNSIGLQNVGVDRFISEKLPSLRDLEVPIVVSIGGRTVDEYGYVAARLDDSEGIAAYEVNISCPNVQEGGLEFSQSSSAAAALVDHVRKCTRRSLWVKLSPNVTSIGELARACEESGADVVTAINTFVGMSVDLEAKGPSLPTRRGGLSGPAIKPLALARVYEVLQSVSIPVVAVGGIVTGRDACEFMLIGARAVQVGTAHFVRPDQGVVVVDEIASALEGWGISSVEDFIGSYKEGEG